MNHCENQSYLYPFCCFYRVDFSSRSVITLSAASVLNRKVSGSRRVDCDASNIYINKGRNGMAPKESQSKCFNRFIISHTTWIRSPFRKSPVRYNYFNFIFLLLSSGVIKARDIIYIDIDNDQAINLGDSCKSVAKYGRSLCETSYRSGDAFVTIFIDCIYIHYEILFSRMGIIIQTKH